LVLLGQVLAGAVPIKVANNVSDTYRGLILTEAGERTAFIKDLPPKELANEVLGAAIAIRLGLPVPPPYLAIARPDRLNARKGPVLEGGRLVYASVDVAQPQVAFIYNNGGGARVLARLAEWQELGKLYGFDALVANIDRHAGNILFSGDREVWVIDHGWCFTGPNWDPSDLLPPDKAVPSKLSTWMTPALDNKRRTEIATSAANIETDAAKFDLRLLASTNYLATLLTEGDFDAVLTFLDNRCRHVPRLAANTLDLDWLI
jgi:hypothetical protein